MAFFHQIHHRHHRCLRPPWCVKQAGGGGPVFSQHATVSGSARSWAWVAGINVAISGKTTLAINMVSSHLFRRFTVQTISLSRQLGQSVLIS